MSLNDPLDPQSAPTTPIPQPPPFERSDESTPSVLSSIPAGVWVVLAVLGVLVVIVIIVAASSIISIANVPATPTPVITSTPSQSGPLVTVAPTSVLPGQVTMVTGSGFKSNDLVNVFLRDPARPADPILQVARGQTSVTGTVSVAFVYSLDPRWAVNQVDVIVQSGSTGSYVTAPLAVLAPSVTSTLAPLATEPSVPTPVPSTWTPAPPPPPTPIPPPPTWTPTPVITAWRGEYFDNETLSGAPVVVRNDNDVNFRWGNGSPDPRVPADHFSARWTRVLNFAARVYRFTAQADDGMRVWVDSTLIIDEWHPATPLVYTRDVSMAAGPHAIRIEYYEGVYDAYVTFKVEAVTSYTGWKGEYFDNPFLSGTPRVVRDDAAVGFDFGAGAPAPGLPATRYSARWTRTVNFAAGTYRFTFRVDDGVRFFVDGNLLINEFHVANNATYSRDVNLAAGAHTLVIEYYQDTGSAYIWFTYQLAGDITKWKGEYFANDHWAGYPTLIRDDDKIDFDWGAGSPDPLIPSDRFSVRYTRVIDLAAGDYQFDILVDDGVRFYIDGLVVIDKVLESAPVNYTTRATLAQGAHTFRVDYVEYTGFARITWTRTSLAATPTPTRAPTVTPTAGPAAPTIETFDVVPASIQVNGCVNITWRAGGGASYIRLLKNSVLWQDNVGLVGTSQDCLTTVGTTVYRIEALNSISQMAFREQTVTVAEPTATATPTSTSTPTPTPTMTVTLTSPQPRIQSFTASADHLTQGQCVTLTWNTTGATTPIVLQANGQLIQSDLAMSGSMPQCPQDVGTMTYTLMITSGPNNGPDMRTVAVEVAQ